MAEVKKGTGDVSVQRVDEVRVEERTVAMGRQEPLPIRPLPEPLKPVHLLGPGMALTALAVGLGETFQWPRLVMVFGPNVRWLFLIGVTLQLVVMIEMARYAMATGESIFFGAARLHPVVMAFFFVTGVLLYIFPGHVALGAQALELLWGIPWVPVAIGGLVLIGLILTFARIIYNVVEAVLTTFIGILVIGSAIIASVVGNLGDVGDTVRGTFAFGYTELGFLEFSGSEFFTDAWFPIIIGSLAFAGPSGMQQMWYTLWLRDKGAGMGQYIPRVRGLRALSEEETIPARGFTFDTADPTEMKKWAGWRKWNLFDAAVLFWGITMLTTVIYTVLAISAARTDPEAGGLIREGADSDVVIDAMAGAFGEAGGSLARWSFFIFMGIVGWKLSFGIFDGLARGNSDMTYFFVPRLQKFGISRIYLTYVWIAVAAGVTVLTLVGIGVMGNEDGPGFILNMLAYLSAIVMGAYCILLLFTNNLLPRKIRPKLWTKLALGVAALMYLGGTFASWFFYGGPPD
jgi:hypothetical protein